MDAGYYICVIDNYKKNSRNFLLYNAAWVDSDEDVTENDLVEITHAHPPSELMSYAWSCGVNWFFVVQPEGIYLFAVNNDVVWFCKKRSIKFFEMFLKQK